MLESGIDENKEFSKIAISLEKNVENTSDILLCVENT